MCVYIYTYTLKNKTKPNPNCLLRSDSLLGGKKKKEKRKYKIIIRKLSNENSYKLSEAFLLPWQCFSVELVYRT